MTQQEQPQGPSQPRPRDETNLSFNLRDLEPGTKLLTTANSKVEVVANPKDGIWVLVRFLEHLEDPSKEGTEELLWVDDVLELVGEAQ